MLATLLALAASLLSTGGGRPPASEPRTGAEVLRAMHDAYAGKWFHTLTFVQQTTVKKPDGTPAVSTWYESLSSPDRLRIDIGDPAQGRGVLYTADSIYVIANGAVTRRMDRGNPLLPFVAGIYAQPVDTTIRQLAPYHFDLSRVRTGSWEGRPVYIVGASDSTDLASPQFWVDRDRLVAVRVLASFGAPGSAVDDVHFDDYAPLAGGWLATKCIILENGTPVQTEEYRDWQANRTLPAGFFVAERWSEGPHWASAAGGH